MEEQKMVKVMGEKMIWEYTTEELKSIIGNFEEEYNESATGKVVRNTILGHVRQGTVDHALKFGAITIHNINSKDVYFIKLPEYNDYYEKENAMRELISRRDFAKSKVGGQE